ncbi:PREDICTED: probable ribose-5-phosphate isomerase 4, chloroplastic [Tarenaya hassleriana]|uniref:probable ribose-5-phosphate isomerase 4, chloroplastic n=1 Tax=Tarenaya hassleriana TaxID=28532 RepID=UPI00053C4492|nr:PREDICTED: probable ribose-5-phosphate isomerase 4, chloroplastic [Tarenaya hassleriana]
MVVVVAASSAPFSLPSLAFTSRRCSTTNGLSTNFSPETSRLLRAARHTVDNYIKSGMVVGLGSGQASDIAIRYLGQQLRSGSIGDVTGVPMSASSASEAAKAGIPLEQFRDDFQIDFAFDDADVIEENTLVAVIGRRRQDDTILQQKAILRAAHEVAFMIKEEQYMSGLEGSVPVLVQSLNWMATAEEIEDLYLGDAEVWRRPSIGDAGPLGGDFPVVTREGHNILDVIFTTPIPSLIQVAESLDKINGVVDHGLVIKTRCKVVIAAETGVRTVSLQSSAVDGG